MRTAVPWRMYVAYTAESATTRITESATGATESSYPVPARLRSSLARRLNWYMACSVNSMERKIMSSPMDRTASKDDPEPLLAVAMPENPRRALPIDPIVTEVFSQCRYVRSLLKNTLGSMAGIVGMRSAGLGAVELGSARTWQNLAKLLCSGGSVVL